MTGCGLAEADLVRRHLSKEGGPERTAPWFRAQAAGPRLRPGDGRARLAGGRRVRRLRLLQGARRRVRHPRLPVGVAQAALPGRLLRRRASPTTPACTPSASSSPTPACPASRSSRSTSTPPPPTGRSTSRPIIRTGSPLRIPPATSARRRLEPPAPPGAPLAAAGSWTPPYRPGLPDGKPECIGQGGPRGRASPRRSAAPSVRSRASATPRSPASCPASPTPACVTSGTAPASPAPSRNAWSSSAPSTRSTPAPPPGRAHPAAAAPLRPGPSAFTGLPRFARRAAASAPPRARPGGTCLPASACWPGSPPRPGTGPALDLFAALAPGRRGGGRRHGGPGARRPAPRA